MIKKSIALMLIFANLVLYECTSTKDISYELPAKISKKERETIIKDFGKGKILFKIHCAECHGIFVNGKEHIPDFSKPQLYTYRVVLLNQDKTTHKSAKNISPLQLDYVLTFLTYKKMENQTPKK